jgi:hypothetical protein
MAESQIKSEEKQRIEGKGYRTALRTINFGIKLLLESKIRFAPVLRTPGAEEVMEKLQRLDEAYDSSLLPDRPEEDVFRDFLMRLRLEDMARAE